MLNGPGPPRRRQRLEADGSEGAASTSALAPAAAEAVTVTRPMPPPAGSHAPLQQHARCGAPVGGGGIAEMLTTYEEELEATLADLRAVPAGTPAVVEFSVGGASFALATATLAKYPSSLLFLLVRRAYGGGTGGGAAIAPVAPKVPSTSPAVAAAAVLQPSGSPLAADGGGSSITAGSSAVLFDREGRIMLNRDPVTFRIIANLLRGNPGLLPQPWGSADLFSNVEEDLRYFQMEDLLAEHFPAPTFVPRFGGAGSSEGGQTLSAGTLVSLVGDFHRTGRVCAAFRVDCCDGDRLSVAQQVHNAELTRALAIGVAVVSRALTEFQQPISFTPGCAVYYNTGSFCSHFQQGPRREETQLFFETGNVVGVEISFDKKRVTWFRNESVVRILPFDVDELAIAIVLRNSLSGQRSNAVSLVPL